LFVVWHLGIGLSLFALTIVLCVFLTSRDHIRSLDIERKPGWTAIPQSHPSWSPTTGVIFYPVKTIEARRNVVIVPAIIRLKRIHRGILSSLSSIVSFGVLSVVCLASVNVLSYVLPKDRTWIPVLSRFSRFLSCGQIIDRSGSFGLLSCCSFSVRSGIFHTSILVSFGLPSGFPSTPPVHPSGFRSLPLWYTPLTLHSLLVLSSCSVGSWVVWCFRHACLARPSYK